MDCSPPSNSHMWCSCWHLRWRLKSGLQNYLTSIWVEDGDRLPGLIDEELTTSQIPLQQANVKPLASALIQLEKIAVLVSVGVVLLVFVPPQLQGDVFLFRFLKK